MITETWASTEIDKWPPESREAAQLVIDRYGEPAEVTPTSLVWHEVGEWKRIVASRDFFEHRFPYPHTDSVASVIDYDVPVGVVGELARFDGSVVVDRTAGELMARCHDEEANRLALNLAHDIVTGERDVEDARAYYAQEFLDARRARHTPYMERLHFSQADQAGDPDERLLGDDDIEAAERSAVSPPAAG